MLQNGQSFGGGGGEGSNVMLLIRMGASTYGAAQKCCRS